MIARSQTSRQHLLGILAGFLFLVAVGLFGTYAYLESQIVHPPSRLQRRSGPLKFTDAERQQFLEKAKSLRERWRNWAFQHQDDIRRMLHSQANDQTALMKVYEAIPPDLDPTKIGANIRDIGADPCGFTWNAGTKAHNSLPAAFAHDAKAHEYLRMEHEVADRALQSCFAECRDIQIATSVNYGMVHFTLWVSGRLTEDTGPIDGIYLAKNSDLAKEPKYRREMEPPYDFLH